MLDTMEPLLLDRLKAISKRVFGKTGVLVAYAFGSRVSGTPLPESDLDIGFYLRGYLQGETLSLRQEMLLEAELSDALGQEVDLRNLAGAPLELKGRVLEEGVRIYSGHDVERVALERELLARYHDYKEIFRQMHETRLRRLRPEGG